MKTILPHNSALGFTNTVTIDAEKFAKLNVTPQEDTELRKQIGTAAARLIKTHLAHVLKENPDFTVGQVIEVLNMAADEIRSFIGTKTDEVEEYKPTHFQPEDQKPQEEIDETVEMKDTQKETQRLSETDRCSRLFDSFGNLRIR